MRRARLFFLCGGFFLAVVVERWFLGAEYRQEFWWSYVYGFFALFGFLGCVAIVLGAKVVLSPWLQRKEDYYHRAATK
jgi:hypothetical protein